MGKQQKPNPKNIVTIGRLKEIIAQNSKDKNNIEQRRKALGVDMSNPDAEDLKDQVRLAQIEDQNMRYGALITKANKEAAAKAKALKSKSDTTVIAKPYKVTTKEIDNSKNGMGLAGNVADSTRKKIAYNLTTVIPSLNKRNAERIKEGKKPITLEKVTGGTTGYGFSNVGKSFGKK